MQVMSCSTDAVSSRMSVWYCTTAVEFGSVRWLATSISMRSVVPPTVLSQIFPMSGVWLDSSMNVPLDSGKLSRTLVTAPVDWELEELELDDELLLEEDDDAVEASSRRKLSIRTDVDPLAEMPARLFPVKLVSEAEMRSTPFTNTLMVPVLI